MERKEFRFQGVDAGTELRLGLIMSIPALLIFISTAYGVSRFIPVAYFLAPVLAASGLTVAASIGILKLLSFTVKDKQWTVIAGGENLTLSFQKRTYNIPLDDIRIIKNMGNTGFRYLTIITRNETVKIRVGSTGFVPFSTAEDITAVDAFIAHLMPYIDKRFNRKILKNRFNNNVFPNFGIYVTKTEKIKYSFINKLQPWQVMICFGALGFILIMVLMAALINALDHYF
jgi:hypothetical protein